MMMNANDEGDPENTNPPCQPSKYVRFLRSLTLFTIDVILWSLFWPRGTQFCCRTLGIVTVRYLLQGICLLCSYALYGTLLVQSGQEAPTFVSDSTSRLLGLPQQGCRRLKREASLHDIFSTRGDQPGSDGDVDEVAHRFLAAIDRAKATYSEEDIVSEVEISWGNKTEFKNTQLNYTAVPSSNISKPGVGSTDKPVPSTSNDTEVSEEQKQISLAGESKDLDMGQNVTDEVDSQLVIQEDTLRQDHLIMERWLRQNNKSYLLDSNSNQSLVAKKNSEVKVVTADVKVSDQVNSSSVDPQNSTLALLDLKSLHPYLFPANSGNKTHERVQEDEAEPEGFTEEKRRLFRILMGCSITVAALVILLVLYTLMCSEYSVCRGRARYLLERQSAEAQQDLAFQFMEAASDRESLRARARNLEVKLQEKTDIGTFAIKTGLDYERENAEYTVDIKKKVSLKRGMTEAELGEVRNNIKRNKAIVDEMAVNIEKSG